MLLENIAMNLGNNMMGISCSSFKNIHAFFPGEQHVHILQVSNLSNIKMSFREKYQ